MPENITSLHYPDGSALFWAALISIVATILLKTLPVVFLKADSMPKLFRRWLDFVPVAVMAALVGPDVFIYEGAFDLSLHNLFLMVSIPTLLVAIASKNYFVTIAFGILLVIICRYLGIS